MSIAPTIDEYGISAPTFADVLAYLQDQYRAIYGQDIYLGNDSQDGQFLGIIAQAITDANAAAVACYNSFSPATGQGNGLSSNVKLNGITRRIPTPSTVDVLLGGNAGTVITNGIVADADGNNWMLPASVTIPLAGQITVTATAEKPGALLAPTGTITKIKTPVYGWQTVTNTSDAVPGNPVETDAALRARQAISVAVPSQTIFEGIVGSVANLPGVTRIRGYENDTDTTDANGIPGHSIAIIVEGGDAQAIAQTIANKKTPGTGTYGDLSFPIIDDVGSSHTIKFSRPDPVVVGVALTIQPMAGYSASVLPMIKKAVVDFINGHDIGEDVIYARVFVPANLNNSAMGETYAITQLQIEANGGGMATSDITVAFDEAAECDESDITITVL